MSESKIPNDRPTCKTCPYWDLWNEETGESQTLEEALKIPVKPDENPDPDAWAYDCIRYPITTEKMGCQSCGEHPDFPEYIKSLKR